MLRLYFLDDIFNCDEFGHFYNMAPEHTIAQDRLRGMEKQKFRLTYLACVNSTGTDKMRLMCFGKAWKPRCFSKQTGPQFGLITTRTESSA